MQAMVELARQLPLAEVIRRQDQLVRRDQALASGLQRTVVDGHLRQRRWRRVLPSVYLTQHDAPGMEPQLLVRRMIRATWMWAGDSAIITGAAAAVWAQYLDDLPHGTPIGVVVPPSRRMSTQPRVHVVRANLDRRDTTSYDGIRITSAYRSAVDLAASGHNDLLHRMAQGKWLRPVALQEVLDRGTHRRGWTAARVAVRGSVTNPHSEAERLTHRALLGAGISDWRANVELVILGRRFRPDLVFDDVKLLVEIDGFAFHGDRDAFERDRSRQNLLTAAGWTVLRFTWRQIYDDPAAVVTQIEQTRRMLRSARGDQPGHPRADQAR